MRLHTSAGMASLKGSLRMKEQSKRPRVYDPFSQEPRGVARGGGANAPPFLEKMRHVFFVL